METIIIRLSHAQIAFVTLKLKDEIGLRLFRRLGTKQREGSLNGFLNQCYSTRRDWELRFYFKGNFSLFGQPQLGNYILTHVRKI